PHRARDARRAAPPSRQGRHQPRGHLPHPGRAGAGYRVTRSGSLAWFARHELRLSWRDWMHMLTAGDRRRKRSVFIALALFAAFMHLIAYVTVAAYAGATRAFYARADLDLILSSPVSARRLFAVRIAAMALAIALMGVFLAAPFIDVL